LRKEFVKWERGIMNHPGEIEALFNRRTEAIVARVFVNERPMQGLAGILDWHFHGQISRYLRQGTLSGEDGEISYIPVKKNGQSYHLILIGGGRTPSPGQRQPISDNVFPSLKKNLQNLKLKEVALSKRDFGLPDDSSLQKNFKGVPLWIVA
jgi:hypothetical protein